VQGGEQSFDGAFFTLFLYLGILVYSVNCTMIFSARNEIIRKNPSVSHLDNLQLYNGKVFSFLREADHTCV